jgi:hypothetical protein
VATVTDDELRQYFLVWQESLAERNRLARVEPEGHAYARAAADEEYDRLVYFRLRAAWREEHGDG